MVRTRTKATVLVVLAVAALVVGPSVASATEHRNGADPRSPAARALVTERPLRIGWFEGAPPVSIWEGDILTGGFATELWDLMAIRLGMRVDHVRYPDIPAVVGHATNTSGLELVPIGANIETIPVSAWTVGHRVAAEIARVARAGLTDEEISLITVRWTGFDLGPDTATTAASSTPLRAAGLMALLALVALAIVVAMRARVLAATRELRVANEELESRVAARTAELHAANEALTRFARAAAHDMKSPLIAIAGFADLLTYPEVSDEQRRDWVGRIKDLSVSLTHMVDMMFDDVRSPATTTRTARGSSLSLWLRDLVGSAVALAGGDLVVEIPAGTVDLDQTVLRRTMVNLVDNATKHALRQGGSRIELRLVRRERDWLLTVDDDGPGVPPERRHEIFHVGAQIGAETSGYGQGLSDVARAVDDAHGTIDVVDSDLGGACFRVRLPVVEQSDQDRSDHRVERDETSKASS